MYKKEFIKETETFTQKLIKLVIDLPKDEIGSQAKKEVIEISTLTISRINKANMETNNDYIESLNLVMDQFGKIKFWLNFLYDEGYMNLSVTQNLISTLNKYIRELIHFKNLDQKSVPATYAGEWFLDD